LPSIMWPSSAQSGTVGTKPSTSLARPTAMAKWSPSRLLALHQTALGDQGQDPAEHFLMTLSKAFPCGAQ
jgi:hypothetical protein